MHTDLQGRRRRLIRERECTYRHELDMESLVWTRGRDFAGPPRDAATVSPVWIARGAGPVRAAPESIPRT
jgi:hypothetical protein